VVHIESKIDIKTQDRLGEIVKEIQGKDELINQYTRQIQQNNVKISKKQQEVDRSNRKYESLTSTQNGKEYGPLEPQIRLMTQIKE
jgi:uncharacterized protein (DUF3084 family)